jgi:uncharacterized protein YeaO (DUF488 family)
MPVPVCTVSVGQPRRPGEGLRLGTVRRPPRGLARERFASDDGYDLCCPDLAPRKAKKGK